MAVSKITHLLSALALAAIVSPAAASAAQPAFNSGVVMVSTAGLDAARPADQAVMRHRIAVAAHKLCGQVTQGDTLSSSAYADCVGEATADATSQLESRIAAAHSDAMVASIAVQ